MKFFKFVCYTAGFTILPVVAQWNWVARANQATGQLDAQVVSERALNKLAPAGPGSPVKFGTAIDYPSGGSEADSVALGDLNEDGIVDVVVANFCLSESDCSEGTVSVLIGNGKGGFQAAVSYGSGGVMASSVAIADVNGDGKLDLVVANYCQSSSTCNYLFGPGSVSVLLGNGDGTFQAAISFGSGGCNADSVAVADVNGDGHPDLVVANYSAFQPAVPASTRGNYAESVAIGDVNGDGRPDLVVADSKSSTVAVLDNEFTASPTVKVTSSPDPSLINQPVTFTATITAKLPIPNGQTVTFYSGSTEIGTGATSNGVATLNTSFPKAKTYKIKVKYSGGGFLKASSGSVEQVVNP
ncbi:MAG TPA: FG-GAP-like repeat-containing protein [Terriglobales bacterium]